MWTLPAPEVVAFLFGASALAGFVDAIAGGGGLILMPALMLGLPLDTPIPTILGTNKFAACTGTTAAAWQFVRARVMDWRELVAPTLCAILGAWAGAHLAYRLQPEVLRPVMLALLAAMLAFVVLKPDLGRLHAPRFGLTHQRMLAAVIGLLLGLYDGFFGPGTGTVLIFLYVGVLGFDFLRASALAKAVNWGSNAAALAVFLWKGSWLPLLAVVLALGNAVGGQLGARLAIRGGNRWVRWVFLVVVSALLVKLGWQTLA